MFATRHSQLAWRFCLVVLAGLIITLFAWLPAPAPVAAQSPAQDIFNRVNQFRSENGLPAFTWNGALASAAQEQAGYMATFNVYSHTGYGGSSPYDRASSYGYVGWVAENIVGGTKLTPRNGLIWWINSPVHLNTLLTTRYTEAGTGFAQGYDQNFYALVVGVPDSYAPSAPSVPDDSPAPIYVTPIEISEPNEDGSIVHVVQEGQTAWAIAAVYEVDLNYILLINGLESGGFLVPGDEVIVQLGEGQEPPPTPTPPSTHVAREGETLWSIAARYDLTLAEILYYNGLDINYLLRPGDELIVHWQEGRPLPPTPTPQQTHNVRSGETLWSIAIQYGLSLEQLLSWNNLASDAVLQINQELRIRPLPSPTETPSPLPATATATPTLAPASPTPQAVAQVTVAPPTARPVAAGESLAPSPSPDTAVEAEAGPGSSSLNWVIGGLVLLGLFGVLAVRRGV